MARWLVCSSVKEGDHTEPTGSPEPQPSEALSPAECRPPGKHSKEGLPLQVRSAATSCHELQGLAFHFNKKEHKAQGLQVGTRLFQPQRKWVQAWLSPTHLSHPHWLARTPSAEPLSALRAHSALLLQISLQPMSPAGPASFQVPSLRETHSNPDTTPLSGYVNLGKPASRGLRFRFSGFRLFLETLQGADVEVSFSSAQCRVML